MTIEQLKAVHQARPFKPFRMHLADGRSVPVRHPEMLAQSASGRTVVVYTGNGDEMSIVDLLLVTRITLGLNGSRGRVIR